MGICPRLIWTKSLYINSSDLAFEDVGYVSSFDDLSDFSDYEDPREDWGDTDVSDESDVLPPEDGEVESPCPGSLDEVAMPARLWRD